MKITRVTGGILATCIFFTGTTAAFAERVLVMGDSIMQAVARSFERQLARRPGFSATSYTHIGTGLARLDLFDWHQQMQEQVQQHTPDSVLVMMGANDNQPMRTDGGVVRPGTREWEQEYARRIGAGMDILLRGGAKQVHWIELPDMRETALQTDVNLINRLIQAEAAQRPQVTYQTSRDLLSRTPGEYSPYILQANGMPLDIRAGDGVHLNRRGADFFAEQLITRIWEAP